MFTSGSLMTKPEDNKRATRKLGKGKIGQIVHH